MQLDLIELMTSLYRLIISMEDAITPDWSNLYQVNRISAGHGKVSTMLIILEPNAISPPV